MNTSKLNHSLLLLAMLCLTGGSLRAQQETIIDGVAAVVGQNIIKMSDIEGNYLQVRIRQGYANAEEYRCQIMDNLLLTKLLVHKAQVDSIEVTDEEVESRTDYYLKAQLQQYGTKEALRRATGYSYDELHDNYFDLIKENYMSLRAQYKLTEGVKITPDDVAEYYQSIPKDSLEANRIPEEFEVAEIVLIPTISETERERVKLQISELRERVLKGEHFDMLARLYSEDPGSAKKGGELGFFGRGQMVSEFESAAFALKPGEVSPVIETQFGYHIIQLIERRGNTVNARHILLIPKVSSQDQLRARMRLDSIAEQVRLGNLDFAEAARTFSDAATKTLGGTVSNPASGNNRFTKDVFRELYPGISITALKPGDVSNATQMKDEDNRVVYRIIQLTKHIPEHTANLTDDYDKLYDATLQKAKDAKLRDWASKMAKVTYIRISDEFKDCHYSVDWLPND